MIMGMLETVQTDVKLSRSVINKVQNECSQVKQIQDTDPLPAGFKAGIDLGLGLCCIPFRIVSCVAME